MSFRFFRKLQRFSSEPYPECVKEWVKIGLVTNQVLAECICGQPHKRSVSWKNTSTDIVINLGLTCSEHLESRLDEPDEPEEDSDEGEAELDDDTDKDEPDNDIEEIIQIEEDEDLVDFEWPVRFVDDANIIHFQPVMVTTKRQYNTIKLLWSDNIDQELEQDDGWVFYWHPLLAELL